MFDQLIKSFILWSNLQPSFDYSFVLVNIFNFLAFIFTVNPVVKFASDIFPTESLVMVGKRDNVFNLISCVALSIA